jgi:hypothetical protein
MTPKEKAEELFEKYYCMSNNSKSKIKVIEFKTAKQCALIAVDEFLKIENIKPYILHKLIINFYQQVKKEIEKL